jgi:hypothetical protein
MNHCIKDYWVDVKTRECFVIHVGAPSRTTVLVRLCEFMDWYIIAEANGEHNGEVCRHDLKELADVIKRPESQYFFHMNSIIANNEEDMPFLPIKEELSDFPF